MTSIGDDDVDVFEIAQTKVFAGDIIDLRVDLNARDRDQAVGCSELAGHRRNGDDRSASRQT